MAIQKLRVTFADGHTVDVKPTLEDTLAFETTLRKNRSWGTLQDSALKLQPFRAWNRLRKTGETTLSWDEFTTGDTAVLDVSIIRPGDDDADEADEADEAEGDLGKAGAQEAPTDSSALSL